MGRRGGRVRVEVDSNKGEKAQATVLDEAVVQIFPRPPEWSAMSPAGRVVAANQRHEIACGAWQRPEKTTVLGTMRGEHPDVLIPPAVRTITGWPHRSPLIRIPTSWPFSASPAPYALRLLSEQGKVWLWALLCASSRFDLDFEYAIGAPVPRFTANLFTAGLLPLSRHESGASTMRLVEGMRSCAAPNKPGIRKTYVPLLNAS